MPNFTKLAIQQSFLRLLSQRPITKITVKDIVEDCGINRNSFYYHFQDLPQLLETMIIENADETISRIPESFSLEEGLTVIDRDRPCCRLAGGRLALRCYRRGGEEPVRSYLITFLPDGSEQVTRELPEDYWGSGILAYGDGLLLNLGRELVCYDAFLTERWRAQLREGAWAPDFYEMRLDEVSEILYLYAYDRVLSFDLKRQRIRAERKLADGESCFLHGVLPGVGAVILVGDSTLQVWDADLKLLSRHRAKGGITRLLHQDGKTFLLTRGWPQNDFRMTENGYDFVCLRSGCLRLYELKK